MGQLSESEEKHLRLRVKQVICGSLKGTRIRQSLLQPCVPQTGMQVPGRCSGWELEFRDCSNPRARTAVDCGERDPGDVREETVVGNSCGGKSGSHGSRAVTPESATRKSGAVTIASLPPHPSIRS